MTNESIIRRMKEKEEMARQDGIHHIILDMRKLLSYLRVIQLMDSAFNSYAFMRKHSPLYKKKV